MTIRIPIVQGHLSIVTFTTVYLYRKDLNRWVWNIGGKMKHTLIPNDRIKRIYVKGKEFNFKREGELYEN